MSSRSSPDSSPRAARPRQILLLGGTTEAAALEPLLDGHPRLHATVSLAGRTRRPAPSRLPRRTGGFGGAEGLAAWLHEHAVDALVDATHPFARQISANAVAATRHAGVPLARLTRPPWQAGPGDHWLRVPDLEAAACALPGLGRRVLITTGRQHLEAFEAAPELDYVIRTIDPPEPLPALPRVTWLRARGPFSLADEHRLLETHAIDVLVTKDSGGEATAPKLQAARERGIPVVMVDRPPDAPGVPRFHAPQAALEWLEGLARVHRDSADST
ncbi:MULTISPECIES: cobalt-precorrin-6A reductase [unclassified Thioalkalivibrio]|uniref:cobalt-precorrin-6A reductase n=1 Tax=unclassified Thioalkalivibrio TaxID=2621013 RepID=UPI00035CF809|nr:MULTISPECIES: cobalt-precorrin-6A reductase [unclassified Thioalkalivibrio]